MFSSRFPFLRAACLLTSTIIATSFQLDASKAFAQAPTILDRCELLVAADTFAIQNLGFEDFNNDGIPDYRQRYLFGVSDCSTVSAQLAWILQKMGEAGALDPRQAGGSCQIRGGEHAANTVPLIGIVDATPFGNGWASRGECWYEFPADSVIIRDGYPDPGETLDPAYGGPVNPPDSNGSQNTTEVDEGTSNEEPPPPPCRGRRCRRAGK